MGLTSEILKFTFNLLFLQRKNGEAATPNRDTSSTGKLGSTDLEPVGALRQAQGIRLPRGRGGSQFPSCPHTGEAGNYRTPGSKLPCSLEDIWNCHL